MFLLKDQIWTLTTVYNNTKVVTLWQCHVMSCPHSHMYGKASKCFRKQKIHVEEVTNGFVT